jgi:uncharacterized secreted protein with C-terminal beta-propeller domain
VKTRFATAALLALVLAFPAGAAAQGPSAARQKPRLKAFTSCTALVKYARRYATRVYGPPLPPFAPPPATGPPTAGVLPESTGDGRGDSSTTNVQEAGVDEPDTVKNDGSYIFVLDGAQLRAVDARSGKPTLAGSLDLGSYGTSMLLDGDGMLVIASADIYATDGPLALDVVGGPYYYRPRTTLIEVDVKDPAAMRVLRTQEVDGSVVSARLSGHSARVVVTTPPAAISDGTEEARSQVRGWVPRTRYTNKRTGRTRTRALASCRSVRRPTAFAGLDMLSVMTVDLAEGLPALDVDSIMASGDLVYASPESLYVATQRWYDTPVGGEQPPRTTTAIHKFDITDPHEARYRASGVVSGFLLNQFAMSERKGVLRVASTDSPVWWGGAQREESQSYVTTLGQDGGSLVRLGRVDGLGRGERIYAVRFFDDKGFVVTFRQVDPLYAIDLSDPEHPRVAGELKIEGYSSYLHPVGEDLLLGIGQDASGTGRIRGLQLSLFDVSDLAKPVRIQRRTIGGSSYSDVEYDHHAFLWWEPEKLAVVPVSLADGDVSFQGAIGFNVDRDGIDEAGRTSHPGDSYLQRSLVVRDRLFTVSYLGVALNDIKTLKQESFVRFAPAPAPEGFPAAASAVPTD